MSKGGRYSRQQKLRAEKTAEKKGKGWKIALSIILVLALVIGIGAFALIRFYNDALDKLNYVEAEPKENGKSYEDIMAEIYGAAADGDSQSSESGENQTQDGQTEDASGQTDGVTGE